MAVVETACWSCGAGLDDGPLCPGCGRYVGSNVSDRFDARVVDLLQETKFDSNEDWERLARRAGRYSDCGKVFRTGLGCRKCRKLVVEKYRYSSVCNLRGCPKCGKLYRLRLVRRYVERLVGFALTELRHAVFTYARVPGDDLRNVSGWVLGQVLRLCRKLFIGAVFSQEFVEKEGDVFYVHVHAIVVRRAGTSFDYDVVNAGWRQLAGSFVKLKPIVNLRKKVAYVTGYALKGSDDLSPKGLVGLMKSLKGRKLVRSMGVLHGKRDPREKPGDGRMEAEGVADAGTHSLEKGSTREVDERCSVCGSKLVWWSEKVLEAGPDG